MKSHEFSELAKWLFDNQKTPASFRTATSRAYYSALHLAIEVLKDMGITLTRSVNKHTIVPDILQNSGVEEVVKSGEILSSLHVIRNNADYDLDDSYADTDAIVETAFIESAKIIGKLNSFRLGMGNVTSRFERAKTATKDYADRRMGK